MEVGERISSFLKEHAVAVVLVVVGVVCVGYGLISLSPKQSTANDSQFQSFASISPAKIAVSPTIKQITVDIEGAVKKPGVYALAAASRIQDAILAAGGMSSSADRKIVAQNLNLAAPLTDGAKIYIPAVGEQMVTSNGVSDNSSGTVAGSSTVNINQATEEELDALPGVGPVTAQKIIANRPYQSNDDLLNKKVVGQSEFTKIKDQVSVY